MEQRVPYDQIRAPGACEQIKGHAVSSINSFSSPAALQQKREEYWDTAPHYGGDRGMCHGTAARIFIWTIMFG